MHGHSEKLGKFTASKSYPCISVGKLKAMVDPPAPGHLVRNGNLCWDNQGLIGLNPGIEGKWKDI